MNKKFILLITHESGTATMLTNEIDLSKAIEEYKERVAGLFGRDKSRIQPCIIKAELISLTFKE